MTICILCGGAVHELFRARDYRRPHDGEEWPLDWCFNCNYGRLRGTFKPKLVSSFYQVEYYTHAQGQYEKHRLSLLDRIRVHLAWLRDGSLALHPREIADPPNNYRTFCDLGCGSGEQLTMFKEAGFEVIGVEPDQLARRIAKTAAEVLDGTAENVPSKILAKRFDIVLLSHVLEHCIEPLAALSNVKNFLSQDGTLIIEVPNNQAMGFSASQAAWPWADIPRHLNFFTKQSLEKALDISGFKITKVIFTGYTRQFSPEWTQTQNKIWRQIKAEPPPNFNLAAWKLLLRTAFSPPAKKYDSIRVHAVHTSHDIRRSQLPKSDQAHSSIHER
jgi:SAM-dependent methyltransferase